MATMQRAGSIIDPCGDKCLIVNVHNSTVVLFQSLLKKMPGFLPGLRSAADSCRPLCTKPTLSQLLLRLPPTLHLRKLPSCVEDMLHSRIMVFCNCCVARWWQRRRWYGVPYTAHSARRVRAVGQAGLCHHPMCVLTPSPTMLAFFRLCAHTQSVLSSRVEGRHRRS